MFPKLSALRELECITLRRMCEIPELAKLGELRAAARDASATINPYRGPVNIHLGFRLDIRLRARRKKSEFRRWVGIGAVVEPDEAGDCVRNASYSLIICRNKDPVNSPIVRKFHIDYEPIELRNHADPKPSVHMQWCGTLSTQQIQAGYSPSKLQALYPDFEKPRIPTAPTSVALMLNWLLLEFQDDPASQPVLRSTKWRALVAEAERTVLVPYYHGAAKFFDATGNLGKRFLQTYQYQLTVD
jgi:hypothetical protein